MRFDLLSFRQVRLTGFIYFINILRVCSHDTNGVIEEDCSEFVRFRATASTKRRIRQVRHSKTPPNSNGPMRRRSSALSIDPSVRRTRHCRRVRCPAELQSSRNRTQTSPGRLAGRNSGVIIVQRQSREVQLKSDENIITPERPARINNA